MEKHFFIQNKLVTLPNVFKFLVLNFGIARSRTTATTKYPLNSRCPSCWRHTSVFFCGLITSNLAGIYRASMAQSPLKIEKQCNYKHILIGVRRVVVLRIVGVKIQNLKVNFMTGGTWRQVGQWSLILNIYVFFIRLSRLVTKCPHINKNLLSMRFLFIHWCFVTKRLSRIKKT